MPLGPSFIRRNLKWVTSAGSHLWSLVSVISFSLSFTIVSSTMSYLCLSSETIITNANLDQNFHMMVLRCWCLNIFEITFFIPWKVVSIFFLFFLSFNNIIAIQASSSFLNSKLSFHQQHLSLLHTSHPCSNWGEEMASPSLPTMKCLLQHPRIVLH